MLHRHHPGHRLQRAGERAASRRSGPAASPRPRPPAARASPPATPRPRRGRAGGSSIEASGASSRTKTRRPFGLGGGLAERFHVRRCGRARPRPRRWPAASPARPRLSRAGRGIVQALLKYDRLVLAAGVGELHDAHLGAALGAPLGAVEHAGAEPRGRRAARTARDEFRPAIARSRFSAVS